MDEDSLARRLAYLKRRTNMEAMTDDNLSMHIEDAYSFFLDYTNRANDVGEIIDPLICEIAAMRAETQGFTNAVHASEGSISRMMSTELPTVLLTRLNRYRLLLAINTEGV